VFYLEREGSSGMIELMDGNKYVIIIINIMSSVMYCMLHGTLIDIRGLLEKYPTVFFYANT
jgi:hypothetical protein